jgi:hypothetical protein
VAARHAADPVPAMIALAIVVFSAGAVFGAVIMACCAAAHERDEFISRRLRP